MEISIAAETILKIGGFPVSNTLILAWTVMGILIAFGAAATYRLAPVPGGLQNVAEAMIEKLYGLVKSVIGTDRDTEKVFPVIVTFFIFILLSNWMGLIPGVGTIGFSEEHDGHYILVPFLRAPASDLNTTLAFAVISVIITNVFGISAIGFFKHFGKFINFKSPVGFFVGILESVAEVAKIISFSFRLFGNVFAGEVLLIVIAALVPYIAPIPFLGLELFVGFIQALVFSMLTLVFIKVAISETEH